MSYSGEEARDMLMSLGQAGGRYRTAERLYRDRYPDRQHYSHNVFRRLYTRSSSGTLLPTHNRGQQILRTARINDAVIDIAAAISLEPHVSQRTLERESGLSLATINRIVRDQKLRPFHASMHQALQPGDPERRLNFCNWARDQIVATPDFFRSVLWSDEATFRSDNIINLHNQHYYAVENPHWMVEVDHQNVWSVNTWAGILDHHVIGPFFIEGNLNGEMYSDFLRDSLPELLLEAGVPQQLRQTCWYQHDGCPAHYALRSRDQLNIMFPGRWIGRGSPVCPWPPRSPDLTCLDFYVWGTIKDLVYLTRPTTQEDMMDRIMRAFDSISVEELENVQRSIPGRFESCINENGRHFEHKR